MTFEDNSEPEKMKIWLKTILNEENLKDFTIVTIQNSEEGDGYIGDIKFVTVNGTQANGSIKFYDMVLKCSKDSQALRDIMPIKNAFLNEIHLYQKIIPCFTKFQSENGIENPFNNTPKCFGSFVAENMEVIALENLKSLGYELYPKKQPMTRKHIDLITTQYAKLHASALALKEKRPEEFKKLCDMHETMQQMIDQAPHLFPKTIDETCELLKNDLDEKSLAKWRSLKDQTRTIFDTISKDPLKVFIHGDCWNNNFMFIHADGNIQNPQKVAFLDWQGCRLDSPIVDLSYFLFTCTSKEDMGSLNDIVISYHKTFMSHLSQLGIKEPESLYPLDQFLSEWKQLSRFGILMASLIMKVVSYDKDEVVGVDQVVESGQEIGDTFTHEIKDKENLRKRILPVAEYAIKHDLI